MSIVRTFLLLSIAAGFECAHAQAEQNSIEYVGHAWETGGFLPSVEGDTLRLVATIDALAPEFGVDLQAQELTLWTTGLVSTGAVEVGLGFLAVTYVGGGFELWLDPAMDHDFGVDPPNATVPSTFRNGTLFLAGEFTSFVLFFDTNNGSGGYEGFVHFTDGTALALVEEIFGSGWPIFGGVLDTAATGGESPPGYDLQVDGLMQAIIEAVESRSWSEVKRLYAAAGAAR